VVNPSESVLLSRWHWLLVGLGVVFYLFVFPHGIHGDGYTRYDRLLGIVNEGIFRPMEYSYVGPLFSLPLHYLGQLMKTPHWWSSRYNTFIFLITTWFLYRSLAEEWSRSQGRLFLLMLFCASMFPKHVTDFYAEVFSACLAATAIVLFCRNRFFAGACLLCLSTWNVPGTLVGSCMVAIFFCAKSKQYRYLLLIAPLAAGIFLENYLKYDDFFPSSYLSLAGAKNLLPYSGGPGFTYPLFFGVLSVLFSYGKGLLFFSSGLLVCFCRGLFRNTTVGIFLFAGFFYICGLVLVFARWWAWSGDWFWGPRFYLFTSIWAVVALTEILPSLQSSYRRHSFWVAASALSFWVGCQGLLFGQDFLEDCYQNVKKVEFICHYVPEYSVLWRPFIVWPPLRGRKLAYAIFFALVAITVLWGPVKSWFLASKQKMLDFALPLLRRNDWKL